MDRIFTQNTHINQISTNGNDRTDPICCHADRMFPDSFYVQTIANLQRYSSTSTYLMKNDLNGQFLTDQPGQPFQKEILEHAGIGDLMNSDHLKRQLTMRASSVLDLYAANENIK
jgi:hypothetical protein